MEKVPPLEEGKARDHASRDFNVNPHYITDMKAIRDRAPDLAEKLKSGEMKIPHAKQEPPGGDERGKAGTAGLVLCGVFSVNSPLVLFGAAAALLFFLKGRT